MLDDGTIEITAGHVVIAQPGQPHGFTNTGTGRLLLTAIRTNDHFVTEWLYEPDGPNVWKN